MTDDIVDDGYPSRHPLSGWRLLSTGAKALVIARMVDRVGGFSMAFLGLLLTRHLGASVGTAELVVACFGAATIPSRLLGGRLLDRFGARPTIVVALIGCAIAQLVLAVAGKLVVALCGAALLGLAYELIEPPTQALIAAESDDQSRPVLFGLLFVSMTVAAVAAGVVAAVLADWDLRLLFVVDAASCLFCAVIVRGFLPHRADRRSTPAPAHPLQDRRFVALFAVASVFTVVYMVTVFGLPLTVDSRRIGLWAIGATTTISAVVGVLAQPLLKVRWLNASDGFVAITTGLGILAVALVILAVGHSVPPVMGFGVLCAIADVLVMSHLYAHVSRLAPPGAAGRYLALFGISWGVATSVAPLIIGVSLQIGGGVPMWVGCAAVTLLLTIATPRLGAIVRHTSARGAVGD